MASLGDTVRDPPRTGTGAPARAGRSSLRILAASAPWLILAGVVSVKALWWTQRPWVLRTVALGALVAWMVGWTRRALRSDVETRFRPVLLSLAVVVGMLGLQGLAVGRATVPVVCSAWLAAAGTLLFAVAAHAGPLGRAKALAAVVSSMLALAALEAGARGLGIGETAQESDSLEIARRFNNLSPPRSAFVNRPTPLDEFPPARVEINSIGIRGPEIPTGGVSLLLLGDSYIEARQLPWEVTLGPRLTASLRARGSAAGVVAHGMRGWSPLLEWNWYLKVGRRLKPERVLLFFFWNDLWPAGTEAAAFRAVFAPDGRPEYFDVVKDSNWLWYRHVRTVRLAEEAVRLVHAQSVRWAVPAAPLGTIMRGAEALDDAGAMRVARRMAASPPLPEQDVAALLTTEPRLLPERLRRVSSTNFWPAARPMAIWTQEQIEAAAGTERELVLFAQDVNATGGRLVIVYVPNPYQVGTRECTIGRYLNGLEANVVLPADSGVQEWLKAVTARHGIEFLDPTAAMRARSAAGPDVGAAPLYLRSDCHWSPGGHQFMADWLADWYLSGSAPGA